MNNWYDEAPEQLLYKIYADSHMSLLIKNNEELDVFRKYLEINFANTFGIYREIKFPVLFELRADRKEVITNAGIDDWQGIAVHRSHIRREGAEPAKFKVSIPSFRTTAKDTEVIENVYWYSLRSVRLISNGIIEFKDDDIDEIKQKTYKTKLMEGLE